MATSARPGRSSTLRAGADRVTRRSHSWIHGVALNSLASSPLIPTPLRWRVYRALGCSVARSWISPQCFVGGRRLTVGEGSFLNARCFIDTSADVVVGRGVRIGMGVTVVTSSHELGDGRQRAAAPTSAPVVIGDGAWVGARAVLLPGVTVGEGAVVGAGAVVTRDVPADQLWVGVPAAFHRELTPGAGLRRPAATTTRERATARP